MDTSNVIIGTIVELKKKHPCGSTKWVVKRIGMDIKLECLECHRTIVIPRTKFNKQIKRIIENN